MSVEEKISTSNKSLEEAYKMINSIFNEERNYYQRTIEMLKGKISDLEVQLGKEHDLNLIYRNKIFQLQAKLKSISNTIRIDENEEDINDSNILNQFYDISKPRNAEKINTFRSTNKMLENYSNEFSSITSYKNNYLRDKKVNSANRIRKKIQLPFKEITSFNSTNSTHNPVKLRRRNNNNLIKNNGDNNDYESYNDISINGYNQKENNKTTRNILDSLSLPNERQSNRTLKKKTNSDKFYYIENKIKNMRTNLSIFKNQSNASLNENALRNNIQDNENISIYHQ